MNIILSLSGVAERRPAKRVCLFGVGDMGSCGVHPQCTFNKCASESIPQTVQTFHFTCIVGQNKTLTGQIFSEDKNVHSSAFSQSVEFNAEKDKAIMHICTHVAPPFSEVRIIRVQG